MALFSLAAGFILSILEDDFAAFVRATAFLFTFLGSRCIAANKRNIIPVFQHSNGMKRTCLFYQIFPGDNV